MSIFEFNDVSIYYEVTGDGHPLVLIHGGALDSGNWHHQTSHFSKKYRVIAYDIRGHGRTEGPEGNYPMSDHAEDLHRLLDYLGIEQIYLAGISMGAYIALNFTLCYPEKVNALVLAGSNSGPTIEAVSNMGDAVAAKLRSKKGDAFVRKFKRAQEANLARPDLTDRLSEIRTPVLLIVGTQDTSTPQYISEMMHTKIANSQLVILQNCGHLCNEEQPDTFNSIVSDFLQKVEAI